MVIIGRGWGCAGHPICLDDSDTEQVIVKVEAPAPAPSDVHAAPSHSEKLQYGSNGAEADAAADVAAVVVAHTPERKASYSTSAVSSDGNQASGEDSDVEFDAHPMVVKVRQERQKRKFDEQLHTIRKQKAREFAQCRAQSGAMATAETESTRTGGLADANVAGGEGQPLADANVAGGEGQPEAQPLPIMPPAARSDFEKLLNELGPVRSATVRAALEKNGQQLELNCEQVMAVRAGLIGSLVCCGPAGAGKSLVLKVLLALRSIDSKVTAVAPEWLLLQQMKNAAGELNDAANFKTLQAAAGVQMTEEGVSEPWVSSQILEKVMDGPRHNALDTYESAYIIGDEVGKVDPLALNCFRDVSEAVRDHKGWATAAGPMRGMELAFFTDTSQCGPILSQDRQEVTGRQGGEFFYESTIMEVPRLSIINLTQVHRQRCEKFKAVLPLIRVAMFDEPTVQDFFAVADRVEFGANVPLRDIQYGVLSNMNVVDKGAEVYSRGVQPADIWKQSILGDRRCNFEGRVSLTFDEKKLLAPKLLYSDATWVKGETYRFSAGSEKSEKPVMVDGEQIRNKELLQLVDFDQQECTLKMRLIEQQGQEVTLHLRKFSIWPKVKNGKEKRSFKAFPLKYARVLPMFSMQGMEFDFLDLDVGSANIGPNLLYTAITRARGSPWEGKLRIKNAQKAGGLKAKLTTHCKSIIWLHKMGEFVPADKLQEARNTLKDDARFWKRMEAIDKAISNAGAAHRSP